MWFPLRTPHIVLAAGKKGHCVLRWPRFSVPPLGAGTDGGPGKTNQELIGGGSQLIIISGFKRKDLRIYFFSFSFCHARRWPSSSYSHLGLIAVKAVVCPPRRKASTTGPTDQGQGLDFISGKIRLLYYNTARLPDWMQMSWERREKKDE